MELRNELETQEDAEFSVFSGSSVPLWLKKGVLNAYFTDKGARRL